MIDIFENGFRKFIAVIDREGLGPVIPNQCEVSYYNQIPVPDGETSWSVADDAEDRPPGLAANCSSCRPAPTSL
jgi:hypothetical protein